MSSTTEWRKLCEGSNSFGADALRAACDRLDAAEARLKVAVDAVSLLVAAIDHKGPNNKLEVDALRKGRAALAKLKWEP